MWKNAQNNISANRKDLMVVEPFDRNVCISKLLKRIYRISRVGKQSSKAGQKSQTVINRQ